MAVFCALALSGCAVPRVRQKLTRALQIKDPPIEKLHDAYLLERAVIVEFSVADPKSNDKRYKKCADRYWAVLVPPVRKRWGAPSYEIHRYPLPQEKVQNATPLGIHPLTRNVHISNYVRSRNEEEFPLMTTRWGSWTPNRVYETIEQARRSTGYRVSNLRPGGYVPKRRLPLLVLGYPFALVADYVWGIADLPYAVGCALSGPPLI
jgi:hypothetical protein